MIGLVILSHSKDVAKSVAELAIESNNSMPVFFSGGTKDGRLGADFDKIKNVIKESLICDKIIILYDIGSTLMTVEMVIDSLEEEEKSKINLLSVALVEGALITSMCVQADLKFDKIIRELNNLVIKKG